MEKVKPTIIKHPLGCIPLFNLDTASCPDSAVRKCGVVIKTPRLQFEGQLTQDGSRLESFSRLELEFQNPGLPISSGIAIIPFTRNLFFHYQLTDPLSEVSSTTLGGFTLSPYAYGNNSERLRLIDLQTGGKIFVDQLGQMVGYSDVRTMVKGPIKGFFRANDRVARVRPQGREGLKLDILIADPTKDLRLAAAGIERCLIQTITLPGESVRFRVAGKRRGNRVIEWKDNETPIWDAIVRICELYYHSAKLLGEQLESLGISTSVTQVTEKEHELIAAI